MITGEYEPPWLPYNLNGPVDKRYSPLPFKQELRRFESDQDHCGLVEWNHARLIIWRSCSSQDPLPLAFSLTGKAGDC